MTFVLSNDRSSLVPRSKLFMEKSENQEITRDNSESGRGQPTG